MAVALADQEFLYGLEAIELGAADYVAKPIKTEGETLDSAITKALRHTGRPTSSACRQKPVAPPRPFAAGEIPLLKKWVVICDVEVPITPLMHRILAVLSRWNASGNYAAFRRHELAEHDGVRCNRGQKGISEAIDNLRIRSSCAVLNEAHIEVGDQDIIRSKGLGYRISDAVTVVVGARRTIAVEVASARNVPDDPDPNRHVPDHVPVDDTDGSDDVPPISTLGRNGC